MESYQELEATANGRCTDIGEFLRVLHLAGPFEIRALDVRDRLTSAFASTHSGYYGVERVAQAAQHIAMLDGKGLAAAIYVTANPVAPALLARAQNRMKPRAKNTTSDTEIAKRTSLLLDIDPTRPAGISATDAEMESSLELADRISASLTAEGWSAPLRGMSGNGAYLLFCIDLPNDSDATNLIKGVLQGLAKRFDTNAAKIDTSTFNAARIMKVLGTMARKGDATIDRPHRRSWFMRPSANLQTVIRAQLEAVAIRPEVQASPTTTQTEHVANSTRQAASVKERCRKYIEKMRDSVQGQHGSDKLFAAACTCVKFDLSEADALEILNWYNATKCQPQWTAQEIMHKLADAVKKVETEGGRGAMSTLRPGTHNDMSQLTAVFGAEIVRITQRGQGAEAVYELTPADGEPVALGGPEDLLSFKKVQALWMGTTRTVIAPHHKTRWAEYIATIAAEAELIHLPTPREEFEDFLQTYLGGRWGRAPIQLTLAESVGERNDIEIGESLRADDHGVPIAWKGHIYVRANVLHLESARQFKGWKPRDITRWLSECGWQHDQITIRLKDRIVKSPRLWRSPPDFSYEVFTVPTESDILLLPASTAST